MTKTSLAIPTVTLGELVAAAFDRASRATDHPIVVAAIAARCVQAVLEREGRRDVLRSLAAAALAVIRPSAIYLQERDRVSHLPWFLPTACSPAR